MLSRGIIQFCKLNFMSVSIREYTVPKCYRDTTVEMTYPVDLLPAVSLEYLEMREE